MLAPQLDLAHSVRPTKQMNGTAQHMGSLSTTATKPVSIYANGGSFPLLCGLCMLIHPTVLLKAVLIFSVGVVRLSAVPHVTQATLSATYLCRW